MAENEKEILRRSGCPLSCTLELVGDRWTLLILRDMFFLGKSTYNEFLDCPEKISTNILTERLKKMTATGLVSYTGTAKRKKYVLTEMGMDMRPVIEAIVRFGIKNFEGSKEYLDDQIEQAKKR